MKCIAITILIAICIAYCTKPADVKLPPYEARLVLHGYIAVGDTVKVALGKTMMQDALGPSLRTYVKDGWVLLYEDNVFVDSLKYNAAAEWQYVSSHVIAASGKTYSVKAGAQGFPTIEATAVAPFPVPTVSLVHNKSTRRTSGGTMLDDVRFSFNDDGGKNNYYLTALYGTSGSSCVYTNDPSIEKYAVDLAPFNQNNCIDNEKIMFTDRLFNGTLKEMTLSTYSHALVPATIPSTGEVFYPYLKRYHITEEYYSYFKTANNEADIFEEGPSLTNPRQARGNVRNGYGLFTIFAVVTDTIR